MRRFTKKQKTLSICCAMLTALLLSGCTSQPEGYLEQPQEPLKEQEVVREGAQEDEALEEKQSVEQGQPQEQPTAEEQSAGEEQPGAVGTANVQETQKAAQEITAANASQRKSEEAVPEQNTVETTSQCQPETTCQNVQEQPACTYQEPQSCQEPSGQPQQNQPTAAGNTNCQEASQPTSNCPSNRSGQVVITGTTGNEALDKLIKEAARQVAANRQTCPNQRDANSQQDPTGQQGSAGRQDVTNGQNTTGRQDNASQQTTTNPQTSQSTDQVQRVIDLVNQQRRENGLGTLSSNATLNQMATARAKELVRSFSHTRPDGRSCFTIFDEYGVSYMAVGENIAYGYSSADSVMNGWMNSSGHRANILGQQFTQIGVGVYEYNGTLYWAQLFAS